MLFWTLNEIHLIEFGLYLDLNHFSILKIQNKSVSKLSQDSWHMIEPNWLRSKVK